MIRGIYLITDDSFAGKPQFFEIVEALLSEGVDVLQYRDKRNLPIQRYKIATRLRRLTRDFGVPFIINDYISLAQEVEADGVHLGSQDADPRLARSILGEQAIIGVSVQGDLARARAAEEAGASYVAMGSVYRSPTKPNAPRVPLEVLREAVQQLRIPVVAIGGITPRNVRPVLETGVAAVAVISAIWRARDPVRALRQLREIVDQAQALGSR